MSSGMMMCARCTREPASSRTSIALSGRNLSEIYLSLRRTASSIALSEYLTEWCSSYLLLMLFKICIVSSTEVGSTIIFWNLLSSAPSFSMYCLYSFSVVAPMHCSSPRESAGLKMFDASSEPLAPPAPTIV